MQATDLPVAEIRLLDLLFGKFIGSNSFFDPFNGDFVDRAQTFSLASVIFNKKEGGFGRKADPRAKYRKIRV